MRRLKISIAASTPSPVLTRPRDLLAVFIRSLTSALYLLSENFLWIAVGFILQGTCAGSAIRSLCSARDFGAV
jgi:hypothetical protein